MTIYEVKQRTKLTSPYFFSRQTLKFFRQTLKDFKVRKMADGKYMVTADWKDSRGKIGGETVRYFDPETNRLLKQHEIQPITAFPVTA